MAEDLLEPDVARLLADPGRRLLGLEPLDAGSPARRRRRRDAGLGSPAPPSGRTPTWRRPSIPTAPLPGVHGTRLILFGAIALIGIPTAIGAGLTSGQPILGILGAVAIGAVCWTFATFRAAA